MAEQKVCWDQDPVHGSRLEGNMAAVVAVYRDLKRLDTPDSRMQALALRGVVEAGRMAAGEFARLKRQQDEAGDLPMDWEKFIRPFVSLTAVQIKDWVDAFLADVKLRKAEAARLEKIANG